jgi:hypothetical protein
MGTMCPVLRILTWLDEAMEFYTYQMAAIARFSELSLAIISLISPFRRQLSLGC